jgi:hypothetical protein
MQGTFFFPPTLSRIPCGRVIDGCQSDKEIFSSPSHALSFSLARFFYIIILLHSPSPSPIFFFLILLLSHSPSPSPISFFFFFILLLSRSPSPSPIFYFLIFLIEIKKIKRMEEREGE